MKTATLIRSMSFTFLLGGCVEPYYPPAGTGAGGLLVIDGFINASNKTATVRLTRAIALGDAIPMPAESKASVIIASSSGAQYPLIEEHDITRAGNYAASDLHLTPADKYKLLVVTASGQHYNSDEVELRDSPEVDSVSWRPEAAGVQFYVSGHDPDNKTRYYRWTFVETFEYNVPLVSYFKKVDGVVVPRNGDEYAYFCWSSFNSNNIMVKATTQLANDVVSMFPIYFIPKGSRKLGRRYRMILQQRAISQQEFDFWQLMKKTTEATGGLFDPIPSQVLGNVHNDENSNDPVLGYFSGGYVDEVTKYVGALELPGNLRVVDAYDFACGSREVFLDQINTIDANEVITNSFGQPVIKGYFVVPKICADCRSLFNGTNVRPKGWPIL